MDNSLYINIILKICLQVFSTLHTFSVNKNKNLRHPISIRRKSPLFFPEPLILIDTLYTTEPCHRIV